MNILLNSQKPEPTAAARPALPTLFHSGLGSISVNILETQAKRYPGDAITIQKE
jgi:hypothetical protein